MKNSPEDIKKFLESIPERFDILEEGIDMQTHKEYFDYYYVTNQDIPEKSEIPDIIRKVKG